MTPVADTEPDERDKPKPDTEQGKKIPDDNPYDWADVRAWLAIFCIVGAFVLQFVIILLPSLETAEHIQTVPSWVTAVLMAIVGFFFGAKKS